MNEIVIAKGLSEKQLQDIKSLEQVCLEHEKLSMKLNLDMLNTRPTDESNDFLCYKNNRLIGFLGLYGFGPKPKEIELTGMVHPEYRQSGIFRNLFSEAKKECISREATKILLVIERSSASGIEFSKSTGAQYTFSEFRMKFKERTVPSFVSHGITLRIAESRDNLELKQLDTLFFGVSDEITEENISPVQNAYRTQYIAERDGTFIGKIGVSMEGENGYIFGVVIKPEYQHQGYGRETLSLILKKLLSDQVNTAILEVAVKNENALSLYKSCGFKEDTIYDYYAIQLNSL